VNQTDIATIKSEHPLPPFMVRDGIVLHKASDHWVCRCPFHREKTPSCHVWGDHFHCFGCCTRGDIIHYIQKSRAINFTEALRVLGGFMTPGPRVSPIIKEERPKPEPRDFSAKAVWDQCFNDTQEEDVQAHSAQLGVDPEALFWLGIVWHQKFGVWIFPMYDGRKRMIGLRTRRADGAKKAITGSKNGLFVPTELVPEQRLFVCEGPTDTAAALTLGFYAIGRASCSSCVEMVIEFIRSNRIREVVVGSDNDSPGISGATALRERLPVRSWMILTPMKDARRYCQSGGNKAVIEAMISAQTPKKP
jgi:DNA primase